MKSIKQQGFTLIELIVVIVILGILAATALPKFVDLSADARGGVMKGVEAAMRGANTMVYGKAAAAGYTNNKTADAKSVNAINGGTPIVINYGYASTTAELFSVLDLSPATDFAATTTTVTAGAQGLIYHKGSKDDGTATATSTCRVEYTPATSTAAPIYTSLLTGC